MAKGKGPHAHLRTFCASCLQKEASKRLLMGLVAGRARLGGQTRVKVRSHCELPPAPGPHTDAAPLHPSLAPGVNLSTVRYQDEQDGSSTLSSGPLTTHALCWGGEGDPGRLIQSVIRNTGMGPLQKRLQGPSDLLCHPPPLTQLCVS